MLQYIWSTDDLLLLALYLISLVLQLAQSQLALLPLILSATLAWFVQFEVRYRQRGQFRRALSAFEVDVLEAGLKAMRALVVAIERSRTPFADGGVAPVFVAVIVYTNTPAGWRWLPVALSSLLTVSLIRHHLLELSLDGESLLHRALRFRDLSEEEVSALLGFEGADIDELPD
jgi:hypothetical protein